MKFIAAAVSGLLWTGFKGMPFCDLSQPYPGHIPGPSLSGYYKITTTATAAAITPTTNTMAAFQGMQVSPAKYSVNMTTKLEA